MEGKAKKIIKITGFVILGIVVVVGFGFVFQALWNWLMPEFFHLKKVTYWQGLGIVALAKILFGGFGSNNSTGKGKEEKCKKEETGGKLDNASQDELYEKWWDEEGEQRFEEFLSKER